MRCPKCHYLSFDPEPRCRNCGYELALSEGDDLSIDSGDDQREPLADFVLHSRQPTAGQQAADVPFQPAPTAADLPLAERTVLGPFDDARQQDDDIDAHAVDAPLQSDDTDGPDDRRRHTLEVEAAPRLSPSAAIEPEEFHEADDSLAQFDEERAATETESTSARVTRSLRSSAPETAELPLFVRQGHSATDRADGETRAEIDGQHDRDSRTTPSAVRPSVAARWAVAEPGVRSAAATASLGPLEADLLEGLARLEREERGRLSTRVGAHENGWSNSVGDAAQAGDRLGAAAIDAAIIGGLSALVLALTLRWCDLPMAQAWMLPLLPTATFLLLVCLGYLLMFTAAGGQTLGKMAMGIRVVADDVPEAPRPVTISQALYRELLALPSVLALGAGFVPGLVGDRRAMHDRLAHTRVVRT